MPELDIAIIGIPLSLNRIVSILILFALTIKRKFRIDHRIKSAAGILFLYIFWCLLTIILSSQPVGLITSISSLIISYLVIFNIYDEFSLDDWIDGFVNVVVVFSGLSLLMVMITPYALEDDSFFRIKGIFIHAQRLSLYANIAFALIFYRIKNDKKIYEQIVKLVILLLVVLLSKSRIVTAFNFSILAYLFYIRNIKYAKGFIVTVSVLFLLYFNDIMETVSGIFLRNGEDIMSLTGRARLWDDLINYIVEKPIFGKGFGYFKFNEINYEIWTPPHGHNLWLHSAYETGIFGALILTALMIYMANIVIKYKVYDEYQHILMLTFAASFFGIIIGYIMNPMYMIFLIFSLKVVTHAKTYRRYRLLQPNG
jgi:O-antigen ligase